MSDKTLARRVLVRVSIGGLPWFNQKINNHLLTMKYTDNEEDKADDLQITVDDREGNWIKKWLKQKDVKRMRLDAVIIQQNWKSTGRDKILDCGSFQIDTIDASGPPGKVTFKAASLPYTPVRDQKKTKTWENIQLSAIAKSIGAKNQMHVIYESVHNPKFKKRLQKNESDIVFLQRLCKSAGLSLKVTASYLVLFDAAKYEAKTAVRSIKKGASDVLSYRFSSKSVDASYSKCVVTYTDTETKEVYQGSFTLKNAPADGQTLEVNEKVESNDEAKTLAEKKLREKNKNEYKVEFTMVGDVGMVAGVTAAVKGWGIYDGKYIVETAEHNVAGGGYTMGLTLRRVLEGY